MCRQSNAQETQLEQVNHKLKTSLKKYNFSGEGCKTSCKVSELPMDTYKIKCFDRKDNELTGVSRVVAGGYCKISCDKPGKVKLLKGLESIIVST